MNVIIRKADEQDFPAILFLLKEFSVFQKTPEKVSITLEQMINEKNFFNVSLLKLRIKKLPALLLSFLLIIHGPEEVFILMTCM